MVYAVLGENGWTLTGTGDSSTQIMTFCDRDTITV